MNSHIVAPTKYNFNPVGECIYCGQQDDLTDEHIIPYALGGTMVLPQSSCKPCAAMTSKFERKVLRGFMYKGRIVADLPSRRKSKRPMKIPIEFISPQETVFEKELPISEALAVIHLPLLTPPAVLCGRPPSDHIHYEAIETIHIGADLKEVLSVNRAVGAQFKDRVYIYDFAKMLAKIAYANVVANVGLLPRKDSPLLPLIRGDRNDFSNWLGSGEFNPIIKSKNPLHVMDFQPIVNDVDEPGYATRLRFFWSYPTTGYHVVTHIPDWQTML